MQGLEETTLTAEKEYTINFGENRKNLFKFSLSRSE